jgi:uncharacterized protein (TIGR02231 family)
MRLPLALLLVPLCASVVSAAELRGSSRIDAVTVFPTGAEVTRVSKIKLEPGEHSIVFPDLPAQALPGSIRIEGRAKGRLEIGSVDSRRVFVARDDEAVLASERKRLEDAVEKLKDERAFLHASGQAAEVQKALVNNLAQLPTRPLPPNAGPVQQPDWSQLFGLIGQHMAEAQRAILETQIKIRESERQIKELEKKLASLAPAQEERTEVKVFVNVDSAAEAELAIRYQVGGASWTPFYDARLTTGTKKEPPKLQLVRRASIQQRSGEDWDQVALSLSTTRPGAGTAAPELRPVTVDFEPEAPPRSAQPDKVGQMRSSVPTPRAATPIEDKAKSSYEEAVAVQEARATIEAQAFQAIYAIPGRVTVPATGDAKRVRIDEVQLDPALTIRTVPKREPKAYLYAKMAMARVTPILPGPVSLFRDATFVGIGRLPLLAPGEEHELGFGIDDAVRVRHAVADEKRGETGLISASKTDERNYRLSVKNLHERPINVVVLDQVPVAQNQDIRVELLGKTAPSKRDVEDKRGVLAWETKLEPDEERVIEFGYRVTWPAAKRVFYAQ